MRGLAGRVNASFTRLDAAPATHQPGFDAALLDQDAISNDQIQTITAVEVHALVDDWQRSACAWGCSCSAWWS